MSAVDLVRGLFIQFAFNCDRLCAPNGWMLSWSIVPRIVLRCAYDMEYSRDTKHRHPPTSHVCAVIVCGRRMGRWRCARTRFHSRRMSECCGVADVDVIGVLSFSQSLICARTSKPHSHSQTRRHICNIVCAGISCTICARQPFGLSVRVVSTAHSMECGAVSSVVALLAVVVASCAVSCSAGCAVCVPILQRRVVVKFGPLNEPHQ